jgi:hypothetical protein
LAEKAKRKVKQKFKKRQKMPKHRLVPLNWPLPLTSLGKSFLLVDEDHRNIVHLLGERLKIHEPKHPSVLCNSIRFIAVPRETPPTASSLSAPTQCSAHRKPLRGQAFV